MPAAWWDAARDSDLYGKAELISAFTACRKTEERRRAMCTRNELNIIVHRVADVYRMVYGDNLMKIILYGSYARGDFNADSDIDMVAIVDGERKLLQEQLKKVWDVSSDLELKYETVVSPAVIPYKEYMQFQEDIPYYRNIKQEGVEIVA